MCEKKTERWRKLSFFMVAVMQLDAIHIRNNRGRCAPIFNYDYGQLNLK